MLKQVWNIKIIYPDSDDDRIFSVVSDLMNNWETPAVCWTEQWKKRYKELIDKWLDYRIVPEGRTNEWFASELLNTWEVDGLIWWNILDTKDMVSTLIRVLGTSEGIKRVSSYFVMDTWTRKFMFADGWLAPCPTSDDLVEMIQLSLENFIIHGMKNPKIALLDGGHENQKISEAWTKTQKWIDWIWENIALQVWGTFKEAYENGSNIFIVPDLNAWNIGYKIAERMMWYTGAHREKIGRIAAKIFSKWEEKMIFAYDTESDAPTSNQLIRSAYEAVVYAQENNITPRVVFLSYSTSGSWYYEEKWPHRILIPTIQAAANFREFLLQKGIEDVEVVEKECQFDAAFIPEISKKKWLGLDESATIYVFPDKFSWSICMDIPESVNGAMALGPLIQWLSWEAHDVSRGIDEETLKKMYEIVKMMILFKNSQK